MAPNEIIPLRIAEFNDAFREALGTTWVCNQSDGAAGERVLIRGRVVMTPGIAALPHADRLRLLTRIRKWRRFGAANNPYGERDFVALRVRVDGRVTKAFFKIAYYEDDNLVWGAENPNDPEKTYRVGTVMLAEED